MRRHLMVILAAVAAGGACGSGDGGPSQSPLVIAKAASKSGDAQTGPAGQALPSDVRVVVTRDGIPEANVGVAWATPSGSMAPGTDQTDVNGESGSTWTLGPAAGAQTATASVSGATGSPVTFTATATDDGGLATIQVQGPVGGFNRFSPATLTVSAGTTVTWQWDDGALTHNVVPDDGVTPATSGSLANAPHVYQYTFNTPGTYRYHCALHGATGGIGMSGIITVTAAGP
jgi:plastocyanin